MQPLRHGDAQTGINWHVGTQTCTAVMVELIYYIFVHEPVDHVHLEVADG